MPTQISPEILKELQISPEEAAQYTFHTGQGCKLCAGTGYWGRVALFEFLPIDKQLGDSLIQGASEAQIRSLARSKGHNGLLECGLEKMKQHITTAEEILAVTFKEDISQYNHRSEPVFLTTKILNEYS
jgi:type II secretory ATPase GspE/PulE/Tfp pilus assembly ATPase PilB-like protein